MSLVLNKGGTIDKVGNVTIKREVKYTFVPSMEDMARLNYMMAALMPSVREAMPLLSAGSFVCVAYPDAATMEACLPLMGTSDDPMGRSWKPYVVVSEQRVAEPGIVLVPDNDVILFVTGHYNEHGQLLGARLAWPASIWPSTDVTTTPANVTKTLSKVAFLEEIDDTDLLLHRINTTCALCGDVCKRAMLCPGCNVLRYCSGACCLRDAKYHRSCCLTVRSLHACLVPSSDDAGSEEAAVKEAAAALEAAARDAAQLRMTLDGTFTDIHRSQLLWNVCEPPARAQLIPSCVSRLRAWRRDMVAQTISQSFLDATIPDISFCSPGSTRLSIVDFGIVTIVSRKHDGGDITVGDVMTAVHSAVTAAPTADFLKRHGGVAVKRVCDTDTNHRRFDLLQPSLYKEGNFRVRLGGMHLLHRGLPATGHHLYEAVFAG
jgi:hypothetical protein